MIFSLLSRSQRMSAMKAATAETDGCIGGRLWAVLSKHFFHLKIQVSVGLRDFAIVKMDFSNA